MNVGCNTVDLRTGIKTYTGPCTVCKGNHARMPARNNSYLTTDERGHIQASSLSGCNDKINICPMAKDLNHGAYLSTENGEKNTLSNGHRIETEKIAFSSNQPGHRPDAFMVNDTVLFSNGKQQEIHHSFANLQDDVQENLNAELNNHSDMLYMQNPGDSLRESMPSREYAELMEVTDNELLDIRSEYQVEEYVFVSDSHAANDLWNMTEEKIEVENTIDANSEWELTASNESAVNNDFSFEADPATDME